MIIRVSLMDRDTSREIYGKREHKTLKILAIKVKLHKQSENSE